MEHESDAYTQCISVTLVTVTKYSCYSHQRIIKGTGGLGNNSGDYANYNIIEIGQNTEKSPGDLRRVAFTQTSVKDHQLTLM